MQSLISEDAGILAIRHFLAFLPEDFVIKEYLFSKQTSTSTKVAMYLN